jgi:hypothetical protein
MSFEAKRLDQQRFWIKSRYIHNGVAMDGGPPEPKSLGEWEETAPRKCIKRRLTMR